MTLVRKQTRERDKNRGKWIGCKRYWLSKASEYPQKMKTLKMIFYRFVLREKYPYQELFWSAFSHIRTKCGKMWTRITPSADTLYAVLQCYYLTKIKVKCDFYQNSLFNDIFFLTMSYSFLLECFDQFRKAYFVRKQSKAEYSKNK